MTRHDDSTSVRQMQDHVNEAIELSRSRSPDDFANDRVFFLALLKLVEIVGEAANRISESLRSSHPDVPWREVVGTRNRLIHGYDSVDHEILWTIVSEDFPPLSLQLQEILKAMEQ